MLRVAAGNRTVEPVELLGDDELAAEPRGLGEAEGEVEHVLLVLARLGQQLVPVGIDDHMAGRAGERALAGALDIDIVAMRDLEHGKPDRRVDLLARAVAPDKHHLGHQARLAAETGAACGFSRRSRPTAPAIASIA